MSRNARSKVLRLVGLVLAGLKGATESDAVRLTSPVTFVHGGNTCGKSRMVTALKLAVLGRTNEVPATPAGILRLATDDDIVVQAEWAEDGVEAPLVIERTWRRRQKVKGKDAGKWDNDVGCKLSTCGSKGTQANQRAIRELFGDEVLHDLAKLLDLSDARRRTLLFDLGGDEVRDAWTAERIRTELPTVHAPLVDHWNPGQEMVLDWVYRVTAEHHERSLELKRAAFDERAAERAIRAELGDVPDPAVVGQMQADIQADEAAEREAAERRGAALQAARRAESDARGKGVEVEQARQAAQATRSELERLRAGTEGEPHAKDLRGNLAALQDGGGWPPKPSLADLQRLAEAARTTRDSAVDESPLHRAREAAQEVERRLEAAREAESDLQAAAAGAEAEAKAAEAAFRAFVDAIALLDKVAEGTAWGTPRCPVCDQPAGEEVRGALQAKHDAAEAKATAARTARQDAWEAHKAKQDEVGRLRNELQPLKQEAVLAEQRIAGTRKARDEAYRKADDDVRARRAAIDEAQRALDAATADKPVDPRIATLEERLRSQDATAAQEVPDLAPHQDAVAEAQRAVSEAEAAFQARMAEPRAELKAAQALLRDLQQAETHKAKALELDEKLAEVIAVRDAFGPEGLMGKVVGEAIGPFTGAVNEALDGLRLGTFTVRMADERGNPVFHLGLERPRSARSRAEAEAEAARLEAEAVRLGSDVARTRAEQARFRAERDVDFHNIETISGGEKAATHAGISLGLAVIARSPWRVALVDELQDLDVRRRRAFLRKVVALVEAGKLDQALLFGCPDRVEQIDGVQVVKLDDDGWKAAAA